MAKQYYSSNREKIWIHLFDNFQDESKQSIHKSNMWKKWLKFFRKLTAFDELLGGSETTFFTANAGGNPEEQ